MKKWRIFWAVDRTKIAVLTPCFLATITLKHV